MKRLLLASALVLGLASAADAAQNFTIGPFTLTGPPASAVTCTPNAAILSLQAGVLTGLASNATAGGVMFTCVVAPANWQGGASIPVGPLTIPAFVGNTFNVTMTAAGIVQTYAAENGSVAP